MITIAIPTAEGRLHGHFGGCREFTLVQADPDQLKILNTRTMIPPPHTPGAFPRWLREQGASVIIAGGIGQRALDLFAQEGIEVRAGEAGAPVEQLARAFINGHLIKRPAGCSHHHGDHAGHDHPHHDGNCHDQQG
jgi:predicted Fe-Mo cluster-binding NifX family protein